MNINLREEEENKYISVFSEYLENIQASNIRFMDVLNENMRTSEYDKLQRLISQLIDQYEIIIQNKIKVDLFDVWTETGSSLCACLKRYRAGDSTDSVCAHIESGLKERVGTLLHIEKGEAVIAERPIVSAKGFDELENICRTTKSEIEDIKNFTFSKLDSISDENDIFGTLKPLVTGIASGIIDFMSASLSSFDHLHEFVRDVAAALNALGADPASHLSSGSFGAGVGIAATAGAAVGAAAGTVIAAPENADEKGHCGREFYNVTEQLYSQIDKEMHSEDKTVTYDMIARISDIYGDFYRQFGPNMKHGFNDQTSYEYMTQRYLKTVSLDKNGKYFDSDEELWAFCSHAQHNFTVYEYAAKALKNIVDVIKRGAADDTTLAEGAMIVFDPIIRGHVENAPGFPVFAAKAVEQINQILAENAAIPVEYSSKEKTDRMDFSDAWYEFKELTNSVYNKIFAESASSDKTVTYDKIMKIADIYRSFYQCFGGDLSAGKNDNENYAAVCHEGGNDKFFNNENNMREFHSGAQGGMFVTFTHAAEMLKNIASACKTGGANDTNLLYGAYVLFNPIIQGHLINSKGFVNFLKDTVKKVNALFNSNDSNNTAASDTVKFDGEKVDKNRVKAIIAELERIASDIGVDDLNSAAEENFDTFTKSIKPALTLPAAHGKSSVQEKKPSAENDDKAADSGKEDNYGRYTVTEKSKRVMEELCKQSSRILNPINNYYKIDFQKMDKRTKMSSTFFDAFSKCVYFLMGFSNQKDPDSAETKNSDMSDSKDSSLDTDFKYTKNLLSDVSWITNLFSTKKALNTVGMVVEISDFLIKQAKKSVILAKLNRWVWNISTKRAKNLNKHTYFVQYFEEHYCIKGGLRKVDDPSYFKVLHLMTEKAENDYIRQVIEDAAFVADYLLKTYGKVKLMEQSVADGVFLNLIRSGLCFESDIKGGTANAIVDIGYNFYITSEARKPDVEANPDQIEETWNEVLKNGL